MISYAAKDLEARRIAEFTAHERETVRAVVSSRGAKSVVIAESLNITEHTLRSHLTTIYDKPGLSNRIDLFTYDSELRLDRDSA